MNEAATATVDSVHCRDCDAPLAPHQVERGRCDLCTRDAEGRPQRMDMDTWACRHMGGYQG